MLIESYVVEFSEVKRCLASLKANDLVIVSENIFALRENEHNLPQDLLSDNTPQNHPGALLMTQQTQQKRYKENQSILKKSIGIYRKDM